MSKSMTALGILAVVLLIASAWIGCSDNKDMISANDSGVVAIARVSPPDGSTGVPTSTSVSVTFTGPVDTQSVMNGLHLAGGGPMHQWRDSLTHYGGFDMMNMSMRNHMMNWLDSIQTPGVFHWFGNSDSCVFTPTATLMPATDYLCLLYEGSMHDTHGGMINGMNHGDNGYHMYGFTTGQ